MRQRIPAYLMLLALYELAASSLLEIGRDCAQICDYHLNLMFICETSSKSSTDIRSIITDISKFVIILKQLKLKHLSKQAKRVIRDLRKVLTLITHIISSKDNKAISEEVYY